MANNEVSGPTVQSHLAGFLSERKDSEYSYRLLFLPETIGAVAYISENIAARKRNVIAGWVLTCVGDDRDFSFLPTPSGSALSDQLSLELFEDLGIDFTKYSWLDRGSDERQYCAPGVDLPISSIMRTKYGEYPEYHTSDDVLGEVVTGPGLMGAYSLYRALVEKIEGQVFPKSLVMCEPHLGKRGLYDNISKVGSSRGSRNLLDVWSYCDGKHTIKSLAEKTGLPVEGVRKILQKLYQEGLVSM